MKDLIERPAAQTELMMKGQVKQNDITRSRFYWADCPGADPWHGYWSGHLVLGR